MGKALAREQEVGLSAISNLLIWRNKVVKSGFDMRILLDALVSSGKKIAGYGASAKSTTFLYQFGITHQHLLYIIDDNIYKQGFLTPGLHIPIRSKEALGISPVGYIVILSWNFTKEITAKLESFVKSGGRVITPFPTIQIMG